MANSKLNGKKLNNATEEEQLVAVKKDPWLIYEIENPSEKVQIAAVEKYPLTLAKIKNPSETVQIAALKTSWGAIDYVTSKDVVEKCKDSILADIEKHIVKGLLNSPNAYSFVKLRKIVDWPELETIKTKLIDKQQEKADFEAIRIINQSKRFPLTTFGELIPFSANVANTCKDILIRDLLTDFRNGTLKSRHNYKLVALNKIGINWPELQVIRNSVTQLEKESDIKQIKENPDSIFTSVFYFNADAIELCKTEIIKAILNRFKNGDFNKVNDLVDRLSNIVNWPELAVIKKSLKANKTIPQLNESSELTKSDIEQIEAIEQNWQNIDMITTLSPAGQLAAIKLVTSAFRYIKNPTVEAQLLAVTLDGYNIKFIINPPEEVQLAAVKNYGNSIELIKKPSEKVQLAAVNWSSTALKRIKNPTRNVKIAAIKNGPYILDNISVSTEILNACKYEILKYILTEIKNERIDSADDYTILELLYQTDWSELKSILKSLESM